MTQILKISKAGYNALTETDPNNLVFSSDYNTLKYSTAIASAQVSITIPALDEKMEQSSVNHNLNYFPFFMSYVKCNSTGIIKPYLNVGGGVDWLVYGSVYCDTTRIWFHIYGINVTDSAKSETFTFYTKVYKNNLGL